MAWLPVWHFGDVPSPTGYLWHDAEHMCALPWRRIVLYDVETDKPLVLYDADGGLHGAPAAEARAHFAFLHDKWHFTLNRHTTESGSSGCLHLDRPGDQRMEMLGCHARGRNMHVPPDRARKWLKVANHKGNLDAYVVHMDAPEFGCEAPIKPLWNALSKSMHAMLPRAAAGMVDELRKVGVRERLYSALAPGVLSEDLLVNNVGVSAAYQSPPHFDVGDVAWTFAFAVKCGECHGMANKRRRHGKKRKHDNTVSNKAQINEEAGEGASAAIINTILTPGRPSAAASLQAAALLSPLLPQDACVL